MTLKLQFEAPVDLSVGRVRISGVDGPVADWTATPDDRIFSGRVDPGFYTAEITPAGVAPQSIIFEVRADAANHVLAPSFSALQASSGNTTFLDVTDQIGAVSALFGEPHRLSSQDVSSTKADLLDSVRAVPTLELVPAGPGRSPGLKSQRPPVGALERSSVLASLVHDLDESSPSDSNPHGRRLSVGLSEEGRQKDAFRPFQGRATLELSEGRLELTVSPPSDWTAETGGRVRLSVAIENVRVERLLLPLYRGGAQVTILPSRFSTNDVELEVLPTDPRLRALARALIAGTAVDAEAVRSIVLRREHETDETPTAPLDPWEEMLSALLSIRFPDVLPTPSATKAADLARKAPWAYDVHVIQARQGLYASTPEDRGVAAENALRLLRKAQACGSPYFAYTNQLFSELVEGLVGHFTKHRLPPLRRRAERIRARWVREQPLQSRAGASFSWFRRDSVLLAAGILAPNRRPTGGLSSASNAVLFRGRISEGRLRLEGERGSYRSMNTRARPSSYDGAAGFDDAPALGRDPGPSDDPNAGRFGGQSRVGGYSISTTFDGAEQAEWIDVTLTVVAETSLAVPTEAVAWFCLYPSFDPQWVKVLFANGRAELTFEVWGGFTVGVWLPHARVELETDLSTSPGAPRVVRTV